MISADLSLTIISYRLAKCVFLTYYFLIFGKNYFDFISVFSVSNYLPIADEIFRSEISFSQMQIIRFQTKDSKQNQNYKGMSSVMLDRKKKNYEQLQIPDL